MQDSHQVIIDYENWLESLIAPKRIKQDENIPKASKTLITEDDED